MIRTKFFLKTLIIISIISFFSCNKKDVNVITFDLKFVKDIVLPIKSNLFNEGYYFKVINKDTSLYLMYYSNKHIFTFNLKTKELISDIYISELCGVNIQNMDSIFIILSNNNVLNDSILFMCNYLGKISKVIDTKKILSKLIKEYNLDNNKNIFLLNSYYKDNKIFLPLYKSTYFEYINDSNYSSYTIPLSVYIDLQTDSLFIQNNIKFPSYKNYSLLNRNYDFIDIYKKKNLLFYNFMFTSNIIQYNIETNEILDTIKINSYFFTDPTVDNSYYLSQAYLNLYYIKDLDVYIKRCKLEVYNEIYSQIIIDKNIKKIGEYIEDTILLSPNIIKGYMYVYNRNKTMQEDKAIVFSIYRIKLIERSLKDLEKILEIKKGNIKKEICTVDNSNTDFDIGLLNIQINKIIKEENCTIIISPVFNSCEPCIQKIISFYKMNIEIFEKSKIYLLALDNNQKAVYSFLKQNNLSENISTIVVDSLSKYDRSLKNITLQHLLIIRDKKISFAKSYFPSQLDSLFDKIIENF